MISHFIVYIYIYFFFFLFQTDSYLFMINLSLQWEEEFLAFLAFPNPCGPIYTLQWLLELTQLYYIF